MGRIAYHVLTKTEARKYGVRGNRKMAEKMKICIESEYVNVTQIGERIGTDRNTASERLRRVRKNHPVVTWALLGAKE